MPVIRLHVVKISVFIPMVSKFSIESSKNPNGNVYEGKISDIVLKILKQYNFPIAQEDGDNPKDIMKSIHYCIFLLNELNKKKDDMEFKLDEKNISL